MQMAKSLVTEIQPEEQQACPEGLEDWWIEVDVRWIERMSGCRVGGLETAWEGWNE